MWKLQREDIAKQKTRIQEAPKPRAFIKEINYSVIYSGTMGEETGKEERNEGKRGKGVEKGEERGDKGEEGKKERKRTEKERVKGRRGKRDWENTYQGKTK